MLVYPQTEISEKIALQLAQFAVDALLEEVRLTPKPGLVDMRGNGCHYDLTLELMERSALSLYDTFYQIAIFATDRQPSQQVREQLGLIGRKGELEMLSATSGVNTHKGAIWALGLITGAAAMLVSNSFNMEVTGEAILFTAGSIAQYPDQFIPILGTNGEKVRQRYSVKSAKEEAMAGFPSIREIAFAVWAKYENEDEDIKRLNVLLSLMSFTDDTCILNRSDMQTLLEIKQNAGQILDIGGLSVAANWRLYMDLENYAKLHWVSPGGSADLLAATIYIHKILENLKKR
jgi:triphosphoribosyl-dephospho-CoA synthase